MVLVIGEYKRDIPSTASSVAKRRSTRKLGGKLNSINRYFLQSIGYVVKPSVRSLQNAAKR